MLADSLVSFKSLSESNKPLHYWYICFSTFHVNLWLVCIIAKSTQNIIYKKCTVFLEGIQFLIWICICVLVTIGYHWIVHSWWVAPDSIPLRMKIEFMIMLGVNTVVLVPTLFTLLYAILRVVVYVNMTRSKSKMRNYLEQLHVKMYNPKFDIKKYLPDLALDFYLFPLKEKEIEFLHREFSVVLPIDKSCSDNEGCLICFSGFKKGEVMTTLPVCGCQLHAECFDLWVKIQPSCPKCSSLIRKNLIEHFHGQIDMMPKSHKMNMKKDEDIITEISVNITKKRMNIGLVNAAESNC